MDHRSRATWLLLSKMKASQHLSLQPAQELQELSTEEHCFSCLRRSCLSGADHSGNTFTDSAREELSTVAIPFACLRLQLWEPPLQELSHMSCLQCQHLLSSLPNSPAAPQRCHLSKSWLQPGRLPTLTHRPDARKRGFKKTTNP